jgi:hypothetical protein
LSDAEYNYNTPQPFSDLYFTIWGTNYKPGIKIFPFLDDSSGDCYWVDLNESSGNYNKIFWTNTFPDSPAYTFSSVTSMFECIAECYSSEAMFLDEEGYLNCDYKKWGLICEKHNPGLKFWGDYKKGL